MFAALLWIAASTAAEPVTFELSDESPVAGERVFYRVAWRNDTPDTVFVPRDLLGSLTVRAYVEVPWAPTDGTVYEETSPIVSSNPESAGDQARPASEIAWVTVPPFSTLERVGELGDLVPDCRGGCLAGDYQVRVTLVPPKLTDLTPGQIVPPPFVFDRQLILRAPALPLQDPRAASLTIESVNLDKTSAALRVRVNNLGSVDAWFPKPEAQVVECDWGWTRGKSAVRLDQNAQVDGQTPWHEDVGIVIPAGGQATFDITCEAPKVPALVKDPTVTARIRPVYKFIPLRATLTPFWFARAVQSEPTPLRR
jgi:hypothetical protein